MEKYVVSRELAEKLKAAGYPQNVVNKWINNHGIWQVFGYNSVTKPWCAAPLSDELLEQIPHEIIAIAKFDLEIVFMDDILICYYQSVKGERSKSFSGDKPADALAALWIWCKENNYIKETHSHAPDITRSR